MIKTFFLKKLMTKNMRETLKKKKSLAQTLADFPVAYTVGFVAEWNSWSLLVKVRVTASCLLFLLVTWHWRLEELKVSRLVFPFLKTNTIQVYKSFALRVLLPSWGEKKLRWNKIFLYLFWCGLFLESSLNLLCSTTSVVDGLFFVFVCLSKKHVRFEFVDHGSNQHPMHWKFVKKFWKAKSQPLDQGSPWHNFWMWKFGGF